MSSTFEDPVTRVRLLPSGVVRVGPHPIGAAGVARVLVPGATLLVDPMTPHCLPSLEISDPGTAEPLLRALFGDSVAHLAVAAEAWGRDADVRERVATAVVSPELLGLVRLGTLIWLAMDGPVPYAPTVLGLELLACTFDSLPYLDDSDVIRASIAAYADRVRDVVADLGRASDRFPAPLAQLGGDAARAVSAQVPPTDPTYTVLSDAARRLDGSMGFGDAPLDLSNILNACTSAGAIHAGATDELLFAGSATADWTRNSPGSVSRNEDSVTWTVEVRRGHAEATVVAERASRPNPSGLEARLGPAHLLHALVPYTRTEAKAGTSASIHAPSWPLALAETQLTGPLESPSLHGVLSVEGAAVSAIDDALRRGTLLVDVHDTGVRFAHISAPDPIAAAARRWTARGICATRMALNRPDSDLRAAARMALGRAAQLWDRTRASASGAEGLERLRAHHCRAWQALSSADGPVDLGRSRPVSTDIAFPPPVTPDVAYDEAMQPTLTEVFSAAVGA